MVIPVILNVIAQLDVGSEPELLPPRFVRSRQLGDTGVGELPRRGLHGSERRGGVLGMFGLQEEPYGFAAGGHGERKSGIRAVVGGKHGCCTQHFCGHRAFDIKRRAVRVGLLGDPRHRTHCARALGDIGVADDRKGCVQRNVGAAVRGQLHHQHVAGGGQIGLGLNSRTGHGTIAPDFGVLQILRDAVGSPRSSA